VPGMNMNPMFNPMMNPLTNPTNVMNLMKQSQQVEYKKVWVGHIPPGTSDAFILRLLESCGTVTSWKRTTDQQERPKGFGLCEYASVESMLKSLRLLNYLKLDEGYELSVKYYFNLFRLKSILKQRSSLNSGENKKSRSGSIALDVEQSTSISMK
jgi:RNA recognition motif-containing protein